MPTLSLDADLRLHLQRFPEAGLLELRLQHLKGRTVCVTLRWSDAPAVSQALRTGTQHAVLNAAEGLLIHARAGHWQAELELRGPGDVIQIGLSVGEAEQLAQCLVG